MSLKNSQQDESKIAILPKNRNVPCVLITAGVGNDIGSEMRIRQAMPNCKFIGADPIRNSGIIYQQLGKYHEVALGATDGEEMVAFKMLFKISQISGAFNMSVMIFGKYQWKIVRTQNFSTFLRAHTKPSDGVIDYLWMDIEGAEYELLPLMKSNAPVAKARTICQVNVELHGPLQNYSIKNVTTFRRVMEVILTESDFIPLHLTRYRDVLCVIKKSPKQTTQSSTPRTAQLEVKALRREVRAGDVHNIVVMHFHSACRL